MAEQFLYDPTEIEAATQNLNLGSRTKSQSKKVRVKKENLYRAEVIGKIPADGEWVSPDKLKLNTRYRATLVGVEIIGNTNDPTYDVRHVYLRVKNDGKDIIVKTHITCHDTKKYFDNFFSNFKDSKTGYVTTYYRGKFATQKSLKSVDVPNWKAGPGRPKKEDSQENQLLEIFNTSNGPMTPKELNRQLKWPMVSVEKALKKLVEKKLIKRIKRGTYSVI